MKKIQEEISNLCSYLYIKYPFYNAILNGFDIYLVSTDKSNEYKIYTEGLSLLIDKEFATKCIDIDKKHLFYYIFHEILHVILLHKIRSISKREDYWNLACDITVDNIISKDEILKNLTISPDQLKGKIMIWDTSSTVSVTTEEIYEEFLKNPPKQSQQEKTKRECNNQNKQKEKEKEENGKSCNKSNNKEIEHLNNHQQWKEDKKNQVKEIETKVKELLLKSEQFNKMSQNSGGIKGSIYEIISTLKESKREVQDFIYREVQNFKNSSSSFKRPDRRYLYNGLIAPSRVKDKKHFDLLFYIDTSGSMSLENISKILYNIFELIRKLPSYSFDIIQSDDNEIGRVTTINKENENNSKELLEIKGRGGTEIKPLFEHLEKRRKENNKKYDIVIVGTDLYITGEDQEGLIKVDKEEKLVLISFENNYNKKYFKEYKNNFLI